MKARADGGPGVGAVPGHASLRARLLLLVVLGVLVPLGMVGLWLTRGAGRSGEALLRARLEASLQEIVVAAGLGWVDLRSDLLELGLAWHASRGEGDAAEREIDELWGALGARVARVELVREGPASAWVLERSGDGHRPPTLPVDLAIHDASGRPIGTLRAWVAASALLPGDALIPSVGSVLGAYAPGSGVSALPLALESDLPLRPRFRWNGEDWIAVQRGLSEPPLVLAMAAPVGSFTAPFAQAARRGTAALVVVVLTSSLLVTLASGRIARPLEELAGAADAVSRGDLGRSVAETGPGEVRRVARAFNAMTESLRRTLDRLAQREAVAAVGEFASALAHEVRNPLTSIRVDLQRAAESMPGDARSRELVERALGEVRRLDATVDGALRMARSGRLEVGPVDAAGPVGNAAAAARALFEERGAVLEPVVVPREPLHVRADAAGLEQVLLNLLINSAEALSAGGRGRLVVERGDGVVRFVVEDEGEGIPPGKLEKAFEPFFTTRAQGTGLGLPVARRIVQAMGGELVLGARAEGGTVATVTLTAESRGA